MGPIVKYYNECILKKLGRLLTILFATSCLATAISAQDIPTGTYQTSDENAAFKQIIIQDDTVRTKLPMKPDTNSEVPPRKM